jgi:uncharacterized protein YkwD/uncharacterized membrane protein required for colicin V production
MCGASTRRSINDMNLIDLLLLLLVAVNVYAGWQRGFILGGLDILRWIVSLLVGIGFYGSLARLLEPLLGWPEYWLFPFSFIATVLLTSMLMRIVTGMLLRRIPPRHHRHAANRALGLVPGVINGLIIAAVVAAVLLALPLPEGLRDDARSSVVGNRLAAITDDVETALAPIFDEAVWRTLNRRTTNRESDRTVRLPYTVDNARARPDLEREMLLLVNEERRREGLDTLVMDPELVPVARRHSVDMFARGYFSHFTPEGRDPFDRIRAARVPFRTAGENLALAQSVEIAHKGLMNSPGHRANILQPLFGRVGIGIVDGGIYGIMVTQNFRN